MSVAVSQAQDWKQWEGELVAGEFPLEQFLGKGDKSAVFRTSDSGREAAIKLVPAAGPQAAALLDRWNQTKALDDSRFLKILKTGTWSKSGVSVAYVVTEFADENLAAVLTERSLTTDETLELLPPVANALAFLHQKGLAHGHLKPGNIFAVNDTLKLSSDSISAGFASADMCALAETTVEVLTQRPVSLSSGDSARVINNLPKDLAEMVRNCAGQNGHPQWSAKQLASWLVSPKTATVSPKAAPILAPSSRRPSVLRIAVGLGAILLIVLVAGSMWKSRPTESSAAASSTAAPVAAAPVPPAAVASATPKQSPKPAPKQEAPQVAEAVAPPEPVRETPVREMPVREPETARAAPAGVDIQVLPNISEKARGTVHGTVVIRVKITIDPSGAVSNATLQPTGSHFLGKLSTEAARKWKFAATDGGPRENTLRFVITKDDTRVTVER